MLTHAHVCKWHIYVCSYMYAKLGMHVIHVHIYVVIATRSSYICTYACTYMQYAMHGVYVKPYITNCIYVYVHNYNIYVYIHVRKIVTYYEQI